MNDTGKIAAEMLYSQITEIADRNLIQAAQGASGFTVPSFKYQIITRDAFTDSPSYQNLTHSQTTYPLPALLQTGNTAYVAINAMGQLVYQADAHTPDQLDTIIPLGILTTIDNLTVQRSQTIYLDSSPNTKLVLGLGPVNLNKSVTYTPQASLSFDTSAGFIQRAGNNFANDVSRPHVATINAQNTVQFFYINQLGQVDPVPRTTFDTLVYDDGGTLGTITTNGSRTVVEEVFMSSNGQVFVLRPQGFANNFNQGIQRWHTYNRVRPVLLNSFVCLGAVIRVSKRLDLTNEDEAVFVNYFCN